MNFDPVGRNESGEMYVKFRYPYTPVDKIQALQRWILVQSFAYYELDESIVEDFKYDANAKQLSKLIKEYPEEAKRSRYYKYFYDYTGDTGYHLLSRVQKQDAELYRFIHMDASTALSSKNRGYKSPFEESLIVDTANEHNLTYWEAFEMLLREAILRGEIMNEKNRNIIK